MTFPRSVCRHHKVINSYYRACPLNPLYCPEVLPIFTGSFFPLFLSWVNSCLILYITNRGKQTNCSTPGTFMQLTAGLRPLKRCRNKKSRTISKIQSQIEKNTERKTKWNLPTSEKKQDKKGWEVGIAPKTEKWEKESFDISYIA